MAALYQQQADMQRSSRWLSWPWRVLGDAVDKQENPSKQYVDEIHAQVVEALKQLYYKHRHVLPGWEHRELAIL